MLEITSTTSSFCARISIIVSAYYYRKFSVSEARQLTTENANGMGMANEGKDSRERRGKSLSLKIGR